MKGTQPLKRLSRLRERDHQTDFFYHINFRLDGFNQRCHARSSVGQPISKLGIYVLRGSFVCPTPHITSNIRESRVHLHESMILWLVLYQLYYVL